MKSKIMNRINRIISKFRLAPTPEKDQNVPVVLIGNEINRNAFPEG